MSAIAFLARAERRLIQGLESLLGLCLIAMVVLNVANALGRYAGGPVLTGADELLVFAMIWIVMLGAVLATRERTHLTIDLLPATLRPKATRRLRIATTCVMAVVAGVTAWHSWGFVGRIGALGQTSMGLGLPMTVPHLAIFLGFAGIAAVAAVLALADGLGSDLGGPLNRQKEDE